MLPQLFVNGLIAGSIYALVALGFGLIYSTTRFFHFAHGAVYAVGAYLTYAFWLAGLSLYVAIPVAVVGTSILGALLEIGVYRPLRRKNASSLILLLASLGLFIVIQNLISLVFGDDTKTIRSGVVTEGLPIVGARITPIQITIIVASALLLVACWILMKKTKMGKAMRAVANDPELARVVGIESDKVILLTFVLGSALAAVAAILISLDTDMTPLMGFYALLMGVVAVIAGGIGSIPGAALGGLLVGMAQHLGVWKISTQWQDTIVFLILIFFLLFRPQGFLGRVVKKATI
jgi:branched-chain amino acid transport system permease protein